MAREREYQELPHKRDCLPNVCIVLMSVGKRRSERERERAQERESENERQLVFLFTVERVTQRETSARARERL